MKLSSKLRESTKKSHQQLEKVLINKLKSMRTAEDYVAILKLFYGFIYPLEIDIGNNIDTIMLSDYSERRKSLSLKEDLEHFASFDNLALNEDLPLIKDKYQAIGALYVLEGSTLGGQFISKMVSEALNLSAPCGISFFTAYGDKTSQMWSKFQQVIDTNTLDMYSEQLVVESAGQTFIKFKNWLL